MMAPNTSALSKLSDTGKTVADSAEDVRGRQVKDKDGEVVGKVADLLIDDRDRKVRFLLVEHGGFLGFGETKSFIPVAAITRITEDEVDINHTRDHIAAAPGYDPELVNDQTYHADIYGYYGYAPFWSPGYSPRGFPG
ncbi:PRC-barrel domain-containing protein [Nocardia sp. NPDC051570]|uniref:PRC-barrel domain-containing protein n=1 Tax=Nocardia sp. NPDC051570 TaxID=3364324 RepID=UPI0037B1B29E